MPETIASDTIDAPENCENPKNPLCPSWESIDSSCDHSHDLTTANDGDFFQNSGVIRYIKYWFHLFMFDDFSDTVDSDYFVGWIIRRKS